MHGRLRSYLLGALGRHLADHLRHKNAEKRGGRAIVLPLECQTADDRFDRELIVHREPETICLVCWARDLIERVR